MHTLYELLSLPMPPPAMSRLEWVIWGLVLAFFVAANLWY